MKKLITLMIVLLALTLQVNATKHSIVISGFTYSPALTSANTGDTVTISASTSHPLVQVSQATWKNDGATALAGGWGTKTSAYTFTVTSADTIYFVCSAHVTFGMKGRVVVAPTMGISEVPIEKFSVSLYPNPVISTATIKLASPASGRVSVIVYNITGQVTADLSSHVTSVDGSYYVSLDASQMANGYYFLAATDGISRSVRKFEVLK